MADITIGERIDQENTSGSIGIGFGDVGNGRDYMAQGFIPTLNNITAISFWLNGKSGTSTQGYKVWIDATDSSSHPTGSNGTGIGGATEITNATLTTGSLVKYSLATAVTLTPTSRYAFVVAPWNTSTHAYSSDYQDLRSSVSNPYANGRRTHGNTAYNSWGDPDSGNADLNFRTWGYAGETITVTESVNVAIIDTASVNDSVSVSEAVTVVVIDNAKSVNVSDSVTVTESVSLTRISNLSVFETITVTEANNFSTQNSLLVFDSVSTTDVPTLDNSNLGGIMVFDTVSLIEFFDPESTLSVTAIETISVEDSPTVERMTKDFALFDSVVIEELVLVEVSSNSRVHDLVSVSEFVQLETTLNISVFDSITITETINTTKVHNLTVSDSINLTEAVTVSNPLLPLLVFESITVTEFAGTTEALHIKVSDTVSVSDVVGNVHFVLYQTFYPKFVLIDGVQMAMVAVRGTIPIYNRL